MISSSAGAAEPSNGGYSRATIIKMFLFIVVITFLLRIWYAGHLYQDDGLWFVAAEQILRGKALYSEIFFDKPPGLPLVYAALFKVFGSHILTIRLFTIFYSILVSTLLYRFGSRFYEKRTGLIAAAMFSVFSTTYISGDMQSLNTDFLMVPFYTSGAYLLVLSCSQVFWNGETRGQSSRLAVAGGFLTGLAFQINPKGAFNLIFLAVLLALGRRWMQNTAIRGSVAVANTAGFMARASKLVVLAVAGFILASLPFLFYVAATGSLSAYKLFVWDLSASYAGYYPLSRSFEMFLRYGTDYFLINNMLSIALAVVVGVTIRQALLPAQQSTDANKTRLDQQPDDRPGEMFRADSMLLIWFAISFAGVAGGGRFFAHYYFQTLPSLCLIGARGLVLICSALEERTTLRRIAMAMLAAGFVYTLVCSHSDTMELVAANLRGHHTEINREARIVAATVRDIADSGDAADRVGAEGIREGGPRAREPNGPSDYLFVWGNWPELYYWSGLLPASRYVGVQPLTGLAADLQYGREEYRSLLDARVTAAARAELARELELTPPKYIVDELGYRDESLSIQRYPELSDLMKQYKPRSPATRVPTYVKISEE